MRHEAFREAVGLLVEDLHEKAAAAGHRLRAKGLPSSRQLAMLLHIESEARRLHAALGEGVGKGERRARILALANVAFAHDSEWPDGGELLRAEHAGELLIATSVVEHLVGEFSFRFMAGEEEREVRHDAAVVLNVLGDLHLQERWKQVSLEGRTK